MTHWKLRLANSLRMGPYGLAATLIITASVLFRTILVILHFPEVNSDEGKMALSGMHLAFQGQFTIYDYGQDYLGVLEGDIAAPLFRVFGVSDLTLRIGMLLMFLLFMIAMYWLTSLLYSKRLALVSLVLLSFATSDMLIQELRTIGGAMELILFGALMMVLAYRLAVTAGVQRRWRYLAYAAWGWTAGIALWVHILVLPFVVCSGLLILVFCYREWRTAAIPCLAVGFLIGGFLLIPGHSAISHALVFSSGATIVPGMSASAIAKIPPEQFLSTFVWGIPLTTWFQPMCAVSDLPVYGPGTASTLSCTLVQGTWGVGYSLLLITGLLLAGRACWPLWQRRRAQGEALPAEAHQELVRQSARLLLLGTGALIILLYLHSPLSGFAPQSTRYLVGLLVVTPAVLWPLWRLTGLDTAQLTLRPPTRLLSRVVLVVVTLVILAGTIRTVSGVPASYAGEQQQMQLVHDLLDRKITRLYLEYWTCYRLMFQSDERIRCARPPYPPTVGADAYLPDAEAVWADPTAPFMFPATTGGYQEIAAFEQYNAEHGKHFQESTLDGMVLFMPVQSG
jgi:hypothetical protein